MNIRQECECKQFNLDELKLIEDSLRYLMVCLDPEATCLHADLAPLLAKVEAMVKVKESKTA